MNFTSNRRSYLIALVVLAMTIPVAGSEQSKSSTAKSDSSSNIRTTAFHGYERAIEIKRGNAKAILCPQIGGRVLEFSVDGKDSLFLSQDEKDWQPGKPAPVSAGRFDYGPELTSIPHQSLWTEEWLPETTGPFSVMLTSPKDQTAGVQLVRHFTLSGSGPRKDAAPFHLICEQTVRNISNEMREVCHWGRSFSPGKGICVIPLGDRPSRFPSKYAMYEDSAVINVGNTDDQIRVRDGFLEILSPPRKPKLGFDATAGWLGYLMPNNTVFIKRFAVYPDRVYNEAAGLTLSVWFPKHMDVIELEPIGPRERLQPGESASFTEDWWLLPFPFPQKGQNVDLKKLDEHVKSL